MSNIDLINITKKFSLKKGKSILALDNINLSIDSDDFVVIAGASGSGKSTLLRTIAGLEKPDSGEVYLSGDLINKLTPSLRNMTLVTQSFSLYPHMTVFENIAFPLKMQKVPIAEIFERVNRAATLMGIGFLSNYKPRALSLGQCQRIAIARAIVRHPQVFLFDEPLSNLDAPTRSALRMEFAQLHKELKTPFVYVTHDIREAMTLATKLVILEKGKLLQVASPDTVYNAPTSLQVAQLISEYPINVFNTRIEVQEAHTKAIGDTFSITLQKNVLDTSHNGSQVCLGVRANDWQFVSTSDKAHFCGQITKVEFAGKNSLLTINTLDNQTIKALSPDPLHTVGKDVRLCVETTKMLFFHAQSGDAIAIF